MATITKQSAKCFLCKERKVASMFYKDSTRSSGLSSRCRACFAIFAPNKRSAERQRRMREKYPLKMKARAAVGAALISGALKKAPCEICGDTAVEAHHDDYSLPLSVRWLCHFHHIELHHPGAIPRPHQNQLESAKCQP